MKQLSTILLPELENLIQSLLRDSKKLGDEWAEKKALFESIEDKEKPMLATLMNRHSGSQDAKKQGAYMEPEWKDYLEGKAVARKDFYQALVNYDDGKLRVETIRSVMSNRREEVKNFRG